MKERHKIFREIVRNLLSRVRLFEEDTFHLVLITLLFLSLILYYTHGSLLVGGDSVGVYSINHSINSVSTAFSVFGVLLGGGNYYFGFYISLFISTYLCEVGIYILSFKLLSITSISNSSKRIFSTISALLYLYNPSILTDTFKSYLSNVSITSAFFILFIATLVEQYFKEDNTTGDKYHFRSMTAGIMLGLSAGVYPNNIRIIALGFLLSLFLLSMKSILSKKVMVKECPRYNFIIYTLMMLLISVFIDLYGLLPMFLRFGTVVQNSISIAAQFPVSRFESGSFNTLPMVFRLLADWTFQYYAPYNTYYYSNYFVIAFGFMWPVFAILLPVVLVKNRNRYKLVPFLIIIFASLFWAKGGNPPGGEIYSFITSRIAISGNFFGPYFLTVRVLSVFYTIFISLSLALLYEKTKKLNSKLWLKFKKGRKLSWTNIVNVTDHNIFGTALVVLLVLILLSASFPAFSGSLVGQYFNENIKGIDIPNEYNQINQLIGKNKSNAMVLPGLNTYIMTEWGYEGSSSFYSSFFTHSSLLTPQTIGNFGQYSQYTQKASEIYQDATNIVKPTRNYLPINITFENPPIIFGSAYYLSNQHQIKVVTSTSSHSELGFAIKKPLDLSNYTFINITLSLSNASTIGQMIKNNGFFVGISSHDLTGWYLVKNETDSSFNLSGNVINIYLQLQSPDYSQYNITSVDSIYLKFSEYNSNFTINQIIPSSFLKMGLGTGFSVNNSRMDLLEKYDVGYIIFDKSLLSGELENYNFTDLEIAYLIKLDYLGLVYKSNYIDLLKIIKY